MTVKLTGSPEVLEAMDEALGNLLSQARAEGRREGIEEGERKGIERAAKVAENPGFVPAQDSEWDTGFNDAKRHIAHCIRALAPTGKETP